MKKKFVQRKPDAGNLHVRFDEMADDPKHSGQSTLFYKIQKLMKTVLVIMVLAVVTGCVSRPVTFVASSKPIEHNQYNVLGDEVTGTYHQMSILFFSFGLDGSSQGRALRDALAQKPNADALIAMSVDTEIFEILPFLCPVIGFYTTRVTGIPVQILDKE